jgi:integrase
VRNFLKAWHAATKAANLPEIIFHDLRRSCARNLTQAGVSREIARQVTGHASESCWNRYNIVLPKDVRIAMERTALYTKEAQKSRVSHGHNQTNGRGMFPALFL